MDQRLLGEEQTYSLRWQGRQSRQMGMPEWLTEGRNIKVNLVKITGMTIRSWEPGGIRRMQDTSGAPKHQESFIQGLGCDAEYHTRIARKGKSHKWTQDCVGMAKESALTCLNLGEPFKPGKDTLAYGIGMALFREEKNRQERSMNHFSVDLRRTRQGHDNQKEENLTTATGLSPALRRSKGLALM
jgi:hypothetical protein